MSTEILSFFKKILVFLSLLFFDASFFGKLVAKKKEKYIINKSDKHLWRCLNEKVKRT